MGEPAQASAEMQAYTLHVYVYGKLIQGHNPRGPIRLGADHRMTGRSSGLPQDLQPLCAPDRFFRSWQGPGSVDARLLPGGCMVYRPIYRGKHHYGLFARVQGRSEEGENLPGRSYTHCAVVVVQDRWEPWLLPYVAGLLFDEAREGCLGLPNYEGQKDRLELKLDPVPRHVVAETAATASSHPMVSLCQDLALRLTNADLALQGRWLPFALGVKAGVAPLAGRFHAINSEKTGARTIEFDAPDFTDSRPPVLDAMGLVDGEIDASLLPRNGYNTRNPIPWTAANIWPDQKDFQTVIARAKAQNTRFASLQRNVTPGDPRPGGGLDRLAHLYEEADFHISGERIAQPVRRRTDALREYLAALRFLNPDHERFVAAIDLDFIRDARDYLAGQLASLSKPHFREYHFSEFDEQVIKAADMLGDLTLRVVQVGNMDQYARLLDNDLLRMPEFIKLDIAERGFGSPFSTLAGWLATASMSDGRSLDGRLRSWMEVNHDSLHAQIGFGAPFEAAGSACDRFEKLLALLLKAEQHYFRQDGAWANLWSRWRERILRYAGNSEAAARRPVMRR